MCPSSDAESKGNTVPTIRVLFIAALLLPVLIHCLAPEPQAQPRYPLTSEDVDRWMEELSNWGRWGPDDQLGALNLITPEKRRQAAALVKDGFTVSLSRDATKEKSIDNSSPYQHVMTMTGLDENAQYAVDTLSVSFHGYAHTHLDALCHMFYRGKMYNGYPQEEVTAEGARQLDIHKLKNGIFTRGILLRHTETEGGALPGTRDSHLSRRSGGLGKEGGIQGFEWGRRLHSDRPLDAAGGPGPLGRDEGLVRPPRLLRQVVEGAGRGDAGK